MILLARTATHVNGVKRPVPFAVDYALVTGMRTYSTQRLPRKLGRKDVDLLDGRRLRQKLGSFRYQRRSDAALVLLLY
jgi:hypothetical protein